LFGLLVKLLAMCMKISTDCSNYWYFYGVCFYYV